MKNRNMSTTVVYSSQSYKKDQNTILGEFVRSLSEDDLRFLASRLTDRYSNDLAEALNFLSKHKRIDAVFRSANSAEEVYELCDLVQGFTQKECDRRNVPVSLNITAA